MSEEASFLQLVPVSSFIQASFWNKLSEIKINIDKLDECERPIWGYFSNISSSWSTHVLEVDSTSFNTNFNAQNNCVPFHGKIFNKNTIEQFKDCDKTELINREGRRFLENLKSGIVLDKPSMLNFFFIISFSDLKKYHFYYWFACPVPHNLQILINNIKPITETFSQDALTTLAKAYFELDIHQKPYFLVHKDQVHILSSTLTEVNNESYKEYYFAFTDYLNTGRHPKTQLKNYIVLLLHYCPFLAGKTANFLLFTFNKSLSPATSLIYNLTLPPYNGNIEDMVYADGENAWAGWEKNDKNKFAPRFANMRATMDPKVLCADSVDLNLKLMKWQLLPDIDLEKIRNLKCLLLGAGTLGCSVARTLLGWGVRNISLVDNSTVSFSNPVRQSLFTYEDSVKSKPKAQAAADRLKEIFPGINASAHQLTIPMPGHSVGDSGVEGVADSVEQLKKLIEENDVIFLLTDSRESRWLPTLLGVYFGKTVINVALGFDTYLIMRYGGARGDEEPYEEKANAQGFRKIPGNRLGCYFCNDVTAPGNSLKDRTLDQQCTVTRPGISAIAGALAVELAISITQHTEGMQAPAFYRVGLQPDLQCEENPSILGILPHSIRGFLSNFTHVLPATPKYNQCIACSKIVLDEYGKKGFEFLLRTFNSSKFLEDLTGLSALQDESNYTDILEISDGDEFDG